MPRNTILPLTLGSVRIDGMHDGPWPADFHALVPRLEAARTKLFADAARIPAAAVVDFPQRVLTEYQARRKRSQLGRIMYSAQRLAAMVDRVVVLGAGSAHLAVRAIMDACCHPFHNELSRGERGGHPRLYFAGHDLDNDRTQGLLDLLRSHGRARDLAHCWGLVIIDRSGRKLETALARQQFLAALRESCGGDERLMAQLVIPITGADTGEDYGIHCAETYPLPDEAPLRDCILTAAGLLPAALLGLDTVKLLEGAAAMVAEFRDQPVDLCLREFLRAPQGNRVLWLAGLGHLLSFHRQTAPRLLSIWHAGLEATGLWYESLLAETMMPLLEKANRPLRVLTAIHPRDALTRMPRPPGWVLRLGVDGTKQDRLRVGAFPEHDAFHVLHDKTWPEIMLAAKVGMQDAERSRGVASIDVDLPGLDEASLGQLWQMLMLSTAVEAELRGLDPYRRSVVPDYKPGMNRRLKIRRGTGPVARGGSTGNRDNT